MGYLDDIGLGDSAPWVAAAWEATNNARAEDAITQDEYFATATRIGLAGQSDPPDEVTAKAIWEDMEARRARHAAGDAWDAASDALQGAADAVVKGIPWQVYAVLVVGVVLLVARR